jgi:hypothetical protein
MASVATPTRKAMKCLEWLFTFLTNALMDDWISPLLLCVSAVPCPSCFGFVPRSGGRNAIAKDVVSGLALTFRISHMIGHVLPGRFELEVREAIVEGVAVFVVDVHTAWNRTVSINPHIPMERMRRLLPFVVAPVINAVGSLLCVRIAPIEFSSVLDREWFHM